MLLLLHNLLDRLLRYQGRIDPEGAHQEVRREIDILFERPNEQWAEQRVRPTINFYPLEAAENTDLRQGRPLPQRENGKGFGRMPPLRFDTRYFVFVVAGSSEDEYLLFWRAMETLVRFPTLDAAVLNPEPQQASAELERVRRVLATQEHSARRAEVQQELSQLYEQAIDPRDRPIYDALRPFLPLNARVGRPDDAPKLNELWSGFGMTPRLALLYTVTVPVETGHETPREPLVLSRRIRAAQPLAADLRAGSGVRPNDIMRDADGTPTGGVELPAASLPDAAGVRLRGIVRDRRHEPLPNARVAVKGNAGIIPATSGPDGSFMLPIADVRPYQEQRSIVLEVTPHDGSPEEVAVPLTSVFHDLVIAHESTRKE
jgi:hypothetical protein